MTTAASMNWARGRSAEEDVVDLGEDLVARIGNVSARVAAEERLRYLAYHDEVTTLDTIAPGSTTRATPRLR